MTSSLDCASPPFDQMNSTNRLALTKYDAWARQAHAGPLVSWHKCLVGRASSALGSALHKVTDVRGGHMPGKLHTCPHKGATCAPTHGVPIGLCQRYPVQVENTSHLSQVLIRGHKEGTAACCHPRQLRSL